MKTVEIYAGDLFSKDDLHNYLSDGLGFPAYYGNNLDALHDCLTDITEDTELVIYDADTLPECVGEAYYESFCRVLEDVSKENSHFICRLE